MTDRALSNFDIEAYIRGLLWSPDVPDDAITLVHSNLRRLYVALLERDERAWLGEQGAMVITTMTQYLGGCTCTFKAPTIPTCRDPMQHLDDCPAKGTGYPVGAWEAK